MLICSVFRGFFIFRLLPFAAHFPGQYGGLLQRILHRFFKVLIRHLQIVHLSHLWTVAHPVADNVCRVGFLQFRLPTGSQVLEQLRPGLQARPFDNLQEGGPEVALRCLESWSPRTRCRRLALQRPAKMAGVRKQRNMPIGSAFVVLSLWRVYNDLVLVPQYVFPPQPDVL